MSESLIKAVVVDDEAPARREMRRLLSCNPVVTVVGDADRLATARGLLERVRPDVVFLDIRLGRESGFDLLDDVDPQCAVVFMTAFDSYAVQAFEAGALDYLVKPIDPERLVKAIERITHRQVRSAAAAESPSSATPYVRSRWVFIDGDRPEFLEMTNVSHVISHDGGTLVHTADRKMRRSGKTLVEWQRRLPPEDFMMVHRGALVNLQHVDHVERWSNYSFRLHMKGGGEPVTMSRRFAQVLLDTLS